MRIIKPNHEIIIPENPYKHIEKVGRICYKSSDMITDTSAEPFVRRLFNSGHNAMLEHFRFIVEIDKHDYMTILNSKYRKYLTITDDNHRYIMSTSARGINDMYNAILNDNNENDYILSVLESIVTVIINEYKCEALFDMDLYNEFPIEEITGRIIKDFSELSEEEYKKHAWYSIHFVCDRGVSHELVRHRDASFAQESTRYCNYSKDKFGNEITVIRPLFWKKDEDKNKQHIKYAVWKRAMSNAESAYFELLDMGATPQEARSVLPNSLKTEIVITAPVYEWIHILNLRYLGMTGAPHPQMKELMETTYEEMIGRGFIKIDWMG